MKKLLKSTSILFITLIILMGGNFTTKAQKFESLTTLTSSLMEEYNVKGIGVVAVKGDSIVYLKAFGKINNSSNFSKSSYLYIASNTKAFTGLAMAKLVNQEKIKIDHSITEYIPVKYFPDNIDVSEITVRDLLDHTTGLSNDPMIFRTAYSGEYPQDLKQLLKFTYYLNDGPDSSFKYSNFGYLLAGIIIENVTGMHWKNYVESEILAEMDLKQTFAYVPDNSQRIAKPYSFEDKKTPIKSEKTDATLHAAGGLFSTLVDMSKFLKHYTQESDLPYINLAKSPLVEVNANIGPFKQTGYGYGWIFGEFNGEKLAFHFGSFPGYESFMSYMPQHDLGVFVFTNEAKGGQRIVAQISTYFYNYYLKKDNTEEVNGMISRMVKASYGDTNNSLQELFNPDNQEKIVGDYTSDKYGTLLVENSKNGLVLKLGTLSSIAYQGEKENELLVEWTPGIIEHLYINKNEAGNTLIQYGEHDAFYPIKNK